MRACRGQKQRKSTVAYIKISEEEIADDYPLPQMYVKEHEETDELLVMGDDSMTLDIDTEALPTQVWNPLQQVVFYVLFPVRGELIEQ